MTAPKQPAPALPTAYVREPDGAEMVEVAPHQYVNRALIRLVQA